MMVLKVKSVLAAGVSAAMGVGLAVAGPPAARALVNEDGRAPLASGFRGVKSAAGGREIGTFVVNGHRVVCIDSGKANPRDLGKVGTRRHAKAGYLMDRYADTSNDYEAAALAYIINVDYKMGSNLAHFKRGWSGAKHKSQMQAARNKLLADANSHAGPYKLGVKLSAGDHATVGDKGLATWALTSASGASWGGSKVKISLHGPAKFDNGSTTLTSASKGRSGFVTTGTGRISASAQTTGTVPGTTVKVAAAKVKGQQRVVLTGDRSTVKGADPTGVKVKPRPPKPTPPAPKPPQITTDLTDNADGDHKIAGGQAATLTDKVAYTAASKGRRYSLSGELMDKATGKATGIKATGEFTAAGASGTTTVRFTVSAHDAGVWAGHKLVAYEQMSLNGRQVASHTDLADVRQSVEVGRLTPKLSTTAADKADGDQMVLAGRQAQVRDTVAYDGLVPQGRYTLTGQLMDSVTAKPVGAPVAVPMTAAATSGTTEVVLPVTAKEAVPGHRLVVFETLTDESGATVAVHADLRDSGQSVWVPSVHTVAADKADGDHVLPAKGGTVIDTIAYHGLQPGQTYQVAGELMDKATGKATGIKAHGEFRAEKADGQTSVEFQVPADVWAGKQLVAFETVTQDGRQVAVHADLRDSGQSVWVPSVHTVAADKADGDHVLPAKGGTVIDTIAYHGLQPGQTYQVAGELMDKATGKATGIKAHGEFRAEKADGQTSVEFQVPADVWAGKQLVAFETVTQDGRQVAVHADLRDSGQSVSVQKPSGGAAAASGGQAAASGGQIHTGDVPDGVNMVLVVVGATVIVAGGVGVGVAARRRRRD